MPSLGPVLCFFLLIAAAELFQEEEGTPLLTNIEEILEEKKDFEDILKVIAAHQKTSETIEIAITFHSDNVLNYGIFEEPEDLDDSFVRFVKIGPANSVTVTADPVDLCKLESGKVAFAYTLSMTLNPQYVTVYQLLFMLNNYIRPKQDKNKRTKKVLVTDFQNTQPLKKYRNPNFSDTLAEAGIMDGSIVIVNVKSVPKELTKKQGWRLKVATNKKATNKVILGKPRSPQEFPGIRAHQCTYTNKEDNSFGYGDNEDQYTVDEDDEKLTKIDEDETHYFFYRVTKEAMIFSMMILFIAFPKIYKTAFNNIIRKVKSVINTTLKFKKDNLAENKNNYGTEEKKKQEKRKRKKIKKAASPEKEEPMVKEPESELVEDAELLVEKKDDVSKHLEKSSSKEVIAISTSAQCCFCKTSDSLKKCRGCR